ncbi:haloacid dehalogenase [Brevibacillus choshinensis]|uniref:Haloacid dehalogenase n=1 Tax=Brevibacillus choshinensis TaxID=54911 RepID=A0ABR5NA42_BRECH|nr:HAD hydrolase-like protein [Brevibacillus choshinensis]KQL47327.1 haloacid dehalogenase [Brevibacillus choshinensis]
MSIPYAILFDMDGTLLQTEKLSTPAFQRTFDQLRKKSLWEGETPDESEITNILGMTIDQVWNKLLPGASDEAIEAADTFLLENEIQLIHERVTDLYPGVLDTLRDLHARGVALFVASNGQEAYIDALCDEYNLKPLLTDLYSAGRFRTRTKNDLVAKLLKDYQVKKAIMVGDRHSDVEAGTSNGLFTIGCDFGFAKPGELDGADVIITDFPQLLDHLPEIDTIKQSQT